MPHQTLVQPTLAVRRLARESRPRPWAQPQAQSPAPDGLDRRCSVRTETKPQVCKLPQLTTSRKSPKAKSQASSTAAADGSDRSCSKLPRPATNRSDGSCKAPTKAKSQPSSVTATNGLDRSRSTLRGILKRQQPLDITEARSQASSTGVGGSDRNFSTTSGIPIRRQSLNITEAKSQASSLAATDGSDRSRPASSGIPIRRQSLDIAEARPQASTAEVCRLDCYFDINVNRLDSESRDRELQHINEAWTEAHKPAVGGSDRSCDDDNYSASQLARLKAYLADYAVENGDSCHGSSDSSTSGSTTPPEGLSAPAKSKKVSWRKVIQTVKTFTLRMPKGYWDGWAPKNGWPEEDESDEEE